MPPKTLQIRNSTAEFLIFTKQAEENGIEIRVQGETIWLSQKLLATLFDCSTDNISLHLTYRRRDDLRTCQFRQRTHGIDYGGKQPSK